MTIAGELPPSESQTFCQAGEACLVLPDAISRTVQCHEYSVAYNAKAQGDESVSKQGHSISFSTGVGSDRLPFDASEAMERAPEICKKRNICVGSALLRGSTKLVSNGPDDFRPDGLRGSRR